MLSVLDHVVEEDMFASKSKKEKPQAAAGGNFLQRSRNAIMGAADAVRRVASKSTVAFQEDIKKTEALVLSGDGMIWSGCSNGLLVQWDGNGNRVQDILYHPSSVLCFCSYGSRIWVGYMSGMVHILDLEGNLIAGWVSHNSPVVALVVGNGNIFSLATHGGIRGWNLASPGPLDTILRPKLAEKELLYTRKENIKILVGTWNVSQGKPSQDALRTWLGTSVSDVGILIVGLQEVEMGAGFLAMSAAKETVSYYSLSNLFNSFSHFQNYLTKFSVFHQINKSYELVYFISFLVCIIISQPISYFLFSKIYSFSPHPIL